MMRDFGGSMKREDYDGVFKALGDEHRLRILRLLAKKELSAGEILESMDIVQSTLSHHMKVLTDNGVVTATRSGKWTIYSVNRPVLQEAAERLEAFLSEAEHAEKSDIAIRARATVAEEKLQEEKKKSLGYIKKLRRSVLRSFFIFYSLHSSRQFSRGMSPSQSKGSQT